LLLSLVVAVREVVNAGVARDDVLGALRGDVLALFADDDAEFRLEIDALLVRQQGHRRVVAGDGVGRLQEQHRPVRISLARLLGVVCVVETDADDLREAHTAATPRPPPASKTRRRTRCGRRDPRPR